MTSSIPPRWLRAPSGPDRNDGETDPGWTSVSEKLAALHGRPGQTRKRRSFTQWIIGAFALAIVLATFFVVEAVRYNHEVLDAKVCPTPAKVNGLLGTNLKSVSGVQLTDLQTCRYSAGTDTDALSIDTALRGQLEDLAGDQCGDKPRFTVAGHEACSMSGTRGTTPGRPSLMVRTSKSDWQLTTNLASVSMAKLQSLAGQLLASAGNPAGGP